MSLSFALALVLLAGCDAGPLPIEYETEHLRIGTDLQLCQGELNEYERTIAFIEDDLGIDMTQTVDLYIWDFFVWQSLDHECSDTAQGCYDHKNLTIYTATSAIDHELAHAVVGNPDLNVFFSEGVAQSYVKLAAPFGLTAPSANFYQEDEYDVRTATHFVRWLREKWGGHRLGELAKRDGPIAISFEDVYGLSLYEAEDLYFAEAPAVYPPLLDCHGPEFVEQDLPSGWRTEVALDCTRGDAHAGPIGLFASRTLVVPEDGQYSFVTDGAWISAYRCEDSPSTNYVDSVESEKDDVPSVYSAFPGHVSRFFDGRNVHTVEMRRGRYNFKVGTEGFEPDVATVMVWPALTSPVGSE